MPKHHDVHPNHSKEAIYLKANKILHFTTKSDQNLTTWSNICDNVRDTSIVLPPLPSPLFLLALLPVFPLSEISLACCLNRSRHTEMSHGNR